MIIIMIIILIIIIILTIYIGNGFMPMSLYILCIEMPHLRDPIDRLPKLYELQETKRTM
jgi:hypothetical protein